MTRRMRHRSGHLLVEAIAAFTILALAMTALFASTSLAVRSDLRAEFEHAAVRVARARLDRLGHDIPLEPQVTQGVSTEGLEWTLTVTPHPAHDDAFWARIEVRGRRAAFEMTTLALARPTGRPP